MEWLKGASPDYLPNIYTRYIGPGEALANARIKLGKTCPEPIVSHVISREVALEAFQKLKAHRSPRRP